MNLLTKSVMKVVENLVIADNERVLALVHEYEKSVQQQRQFRNKPKSIWALLM